MKEQLKEAAVSMGKVLIGLVMIAATTAVFVTVFNHLDTIQAKSTEEKSSSAVTSAPSVNSETKNAWVQNKTVRQSSDWQLVLVNFNNKMPDDFKQTIVHQFNMDMESRIVTPYQKMHDAALKDNIHIWLSSGYRNYDKQQKLYMDEIQAFRKTGLSYEDAVSKAGKSVARPGYSEHNTGLAIDINGVLDSFDGTPAFQWMQKHAQEYGFILRYPKDKQDITEIKFEPWHYRYVGVENAKKMKELNMCLEEYVDYLNKNPTASN